jgi:hypothetical protein
MEKWRWWKKKLHCLSFRYVFHAMVIGWREASTRYHVLPDLSILCQCARCSYLVFVVLLNLSL